MVLSLPIYRRTAPIFHSATVSSSQNGVVPGAVQRGEGDAGGGCGPAVVLHVNPEWGPNP